MLITSALAVGAFSPIKINVESAQINLLPLFVRLNLEIMCAAQNIFAMNSLHQLLQQKVIHRQEQKHQ
jgi:hypothetical protein